VLDRAGEKFRRVLQLIALTVLNPVAFVLGAAVARVLKLDPTKAVLFRTGMSMKVSLSKEDTKPALLLTLLKITVLPLVAWGLSGVFGFWEMPVVWKAAVIISAMPMAFLSMVPPALYGLDGKFTTTAWVFSMLSMVVTLPLLMLLGAL